MKIVFIFLALMIACPMNCLCQETVNGIHVEENPVSYETELIFSDGSRYSGQIIEGSLQGRGELIYSDGCKYVGAFFDNEINGHGMLIFPDKTRYVGDFKNGRFSGQGVISFPDGSQYEGAFKDDQYHGYGKWFSPDGIRYEGEFLNNHFSGQGVYSLPDGSQYKGSFSRDRFSGNGSWTAGNTLETRPSVKESMNIASDNLFQDIPPDIRMVSNEEISLVEEKRVYHEAVESLQNEKQDIEGYHEISEPAFSVQVGAFLSNENAENLAVMLREKGYDARMLILEDAAGTSWYTVRLGTHHGSLEAAQQKAMAFFEKENMSAIVRPVGSL